MDVKEKLVEVREKLVELLTDDLPRIGNLPKCDNPLQYTMGEIVERIADHLIANDVTVREWMVAISAKSLILQEQEQKSINTAHILALRFVTQNSPMKNDLSFALCVDGDCPNRRKENDYEH